MESFLQFVRSRPRWAELDNFLAHLSPTRRRMIDAAAEEWHQAEPKSRYRTRSPEPQVTLFESRCVE